MTRTLLLLLLIYTIFCLSCSHNPYSENLSDALTKYASDGSIPSEKGDSSPRTESILGKTAGLNDYLRYAALHNPSLRAAFERWKAALYKIPQAKALPDPRFSYAYFIKKVETKVGPQRQKFSLSQTFPWISKLELKGDIASQEAKAKRALFEAEKWRLFSRVKKAYFEYGYLKRAIGIVKDNISLLKGLEQVVRTQYSSGKAPYGTIIRIQTEIGRLEDRLSSLNDLRAPIMAELNADLNRPINAPIPWPRPTKIKIQKFDERQAMVWLKKGNPELKAIKSLRERERFKLRLAKKDYFPDITLSAQMIDTGEAENKNTPDSGKDPVIVGFSLNIPIWANKYNADVRQKFSQLMAISHKEQDKENELMSQLKLKLYKLRDAERKMNLYHRELIPKASQSFNQSLEDLKTGVGTFTDVVDAERLLLEFELSYERARTDRLKILADMERLLGRELIEVED